MGYRLNKAVLLSSIAKDLELEFLGKDCDIKSVAPLSQCQKGDITFTKTLVEVEEGTILVAPSTIGLNAESYSILISNNPRLDFIRVLNLLEKEIGFSTYVFPPKIHPSAILGRNTIIEDGCIIHENVIIEHNVTIHSGTIIGKNSRIRSNSSIGGDGFGFERLEDGTPLRFPHLGGVSIGENVEVGSCSTIAKGTLGDTIIEDNVKIDNLVHIAHNCRVYNGAFIIACAELSGGVVIGKNAWIAPNSSTHQKITIGDEAIIGLGAVVIKDVPAKSVYAGNPAKKIREIK